MRVLVAAASSRLRRELDELLAGWRYAPESHAEGRAAWEALEAPGGPRLALWQLDLPGLDAVAAARRLRGADAPRYVHLLVLAERGESSPPLPAVEAGADDLLFLPVNAEELKVRLALARRSLHLQERLVALDEAVRQQADRDPVTNVWNRRAIAEMLSHELARANRDNEWVTVLALHLDGFKAVNEAHGAEAGDRVIREAAERLRTAIRASDWLGRNVAAKYFLLLPGCNPDRAVATAERLRLAAAERPFPLGDGRAVPLTASVGLASDRGGSIPAEELLDRATDALRRARAEGGDTVRQATPTQAGQLPLA
jgi:two-component system cell cycle response regulator